MAFSFSSPSAIIPNIPTEPAPNSPYTPSSVSSILTSTRIGLGGSWSNMSHISQTRPPTVTDVEIEPISRHPAYYIPSGDVVFLAGAQLFRVHRYFFVRESVKFRDMLSVVAPNGMELSGSSDSRAIHLPDVTKEEFENFLWIFYNDDYEYEAPLEKWSTVLRLAHMWQFPKIKLLVTRKMDKFYIEPVDKAVMARDYEVDPDYGWLEQAYAALGVRELSISRSEGARLGLDVVIHLADLRERILREKLDEEKISLQERDVAFDSPPPAKSVIVSPFQRDQPALFHEKAPVESPLSRSNLLQDHSEWVRNRSPPRRIVTLEDELADSLDNPAPTPAPVPVPGLEDAWPIAKGKKKKSKRTDGYY